MGEARVFVDTNVFAYALDDDEPDKQARAQRLIQERRKEIVISTQVLIELYAVCTRKLGMDRADARSATEALLGFPVMDTDRSLMVLALTLAERAQLSIFDAAIVRAAQRARCGVLLSEDLGDGQTFDDLVVENPFIT